MKRSFLVVSALVAVAISATSCTGSGAHPSAKSTSHVGRAVPTISQGEGLAPGVFVAVSQQKLGLFDASSGRVVRWLLTESYQGMTVDATAVDRSGLIWATLSNGPACTGPVAGCGPRPNSCAGNVITINPSTRAVASVLTAPSDELIAGAQPSPNGRYLAYLDGRCDRSYFNQYIRVQDLTTRASWTIGAGLTPCHILNSLSWAPDGMHLVARYGRSLVTPAASASYGFGTCDVPSAATVTVIPALSEQPGINGLTASAETGCEIEAVTATSTGYAAIEGCGARSDYLSGPIRLIRYSTHLQRSVEATLGTCVDGAELRANHTGAGLLGTTYQFCAPGPPGPKTVTFTDHGHAPMTFYTKANGGNDVFRSISW